MKLTFFGAAKCVTGACMMLETGKSKIIIDCGTAQGNDFKILGKTLAFKAKEIDAVLLTHAHVDHIGKVPLMVKNGFCGTIWCTEATCDLASVILEDSANLMKNEAERKNRKLIKTGKEPTEVPLYGIEDVSRTLKLFDSLSYGQTFEPAPGIKATFTDAGHMLGSASVIIETEGKRIVFSGDIGNTNQSIINDPTYIKKTDYAVMESTYGDRYHPADSDQSTAAKADELLRVINRTYARDGQLIIPCFAVGRTQEILYLLHTISKKKKLEVYLDSPMAEKATRIFNENAENFYDSEALEMVNRGENPLDFPGLKQIKDTEESKALNSYSAPCIIIASSGMCEGGRIIHHLLHKLDNPANTILFTGYQANGTLGRKILDGENNVYINGERIQVRAQVCQMKDMSGHADRNGLFRWAESFENKPKTIFVIHGGKNISTSFANDLNNKGFKAVCPDFRESFEL